MAKATVSFRSSGASLSFMWRHLGTLKNGSVFCPLFSVFGPEPIKARVTIGDAKAIVTTQALYRRKIEPWRKDVAGLRHVLLVDRDGARVKGTIDLPPLLDAADESFHNRADGA